MGLFGWLFGRRERVASRDVVWLSDAARLAGVARAIDSHLAAGRPVLVLAHFPATLAAFGKYLISPHRTIEAVPTVLTPRSALDLAASGPRALFGLVRNLRPDEGPADEAAPPSPLAVVTIERHFLRAQDDRVVAFAGGLGGTAAVDFHVSLDDHLLKMFAGERVATLLRRLGAKEDESINSGLVSRRVHAAQGMVANTIRTDHECDAPTEWLERNQAG